MKHLEDFRECESYKEGCGQVKTTENQLGKDDVPMPWTSNVLTPETASIVWRVKRPPIIAMIGLAKSGKTSFLATLYLLLSRGKVGSYQFAGSLTLRGWAAITTKQYWKGGEKPGFPPRTTGEGREAGFLHLTLEFEGKLSDVLIADIPGEWFRPLLKELDSPLTQSVRDVLTYASAAIYLIDSESLLRGDDKHKAQEYTKRLLRLSHKINKNLPIVPALSKFDVVTEADTEQLEELLEDISENLVDTQVFHTVSASAEIPSGQEKQSLKRGNDVAEAFISALTHSAPKTTQHMSLTRDEVSRQLSQFVRSR